MCLVRGVSENVFNKSVYEKPKIRVHSQVEENPAHTQIRQHARQLGQQGPIGFDDWLDSCGHTMRLVVFATHRNSPGPMKPLLLACALALATGKPTSRPRHESTAALVAGGDAKPTLAHGEALEAKLRELERTVDVRAAKHDASVEGGAKTGAAKTGATAHDKASAHVTPENAERQRRRSRTVTEGEVAATVNSTLDSFLGCARSICCMP